jgi:hypothetical protein
MSGNKKKQFCGEVLEYIQNSDERMSMRVKKFLESGFKSTDCKENNKQKYILYLQSDGFEPCPPKNVSNPG